MRLYTTALVVIVILFIGHLLGNHFDLYLSWWFYDILMHILGGLGIGLSVMAIVKTYFPSIVHKKCFVVFAVICAGLVWELFEAYYNISGHPVGSKLYYVDTIKDLIDDVIGGILAVRIFGKNTF